LEVHADASVTEGQVTAISVTGMGTGTNELFTIHEEVFGAEVDTSEPASGAIYYAVRSVVDGVSSISSTVEAVHVYLGTGDDMLVVDSTYASGATHVHGGAGDDTIEFRSTTTGLNPADTDRVDFIDGALTVHGDAGDDTVIIDDSGDDAVNVGTVATDGISGFGIEGSVA